MVHDASSQDADGPARIIAGRYRLHAPIGAGGMGEVWHAYDERLDRRVAVKMMLAESPVATGLQGEDFEESLQIRRARFLREVRTTASLEHLGIPAVYDTGVDGTTGRLFVVMQLLQGRELQTFIDETDYADTPVPVSWAAAAGAQIASVLDVVHQHDVVHRDIKPSNLMLTPGGGQGAGFWGGGLARCRDQSPTHPGRDDGGHTAVYVSGAESRQRCRAGCRCLRPGLRAL
jgi:serine/threonine protein kinase